MHDFSNFVIAKQTNINFFFSDATGPYPHLILYVSRSIITRLITATTPWSTDAITAVVIWAIPIAIASPFVVIITICGNAPQSILLLPVGGITICLFLWCCGVIFYYRLPKTTTNKIFVCSKWQKVQHWPQNQSRCCSQISKFQESSIWRHKWLHLHNYPLPILKQTVDKRSAILI